MDCFHDFCLACDRQSSSGPYCSQACRLADLENANKSTSPPASPTLATSSSKARHGHQSSYQWATPSNKPHPTNRYANSSPRNTTSTWSSAFMLGARPPTTPMTTSPTEPFERSLTPSSSRSSLSSDPSGSLSSSATLVSSQAQRELQGYFNSFDKTRSTKKRQWTW